MNKLTKENITIGHEKMVQLVKFCKQYDDPITVAFERGRIIKDNRLRKITYVKLIV